MEHPLALDPGLGGRHRPEHVVVHIVGLNAEKHVGLERVIEGAAPVFFGERRDRKTRRAAGHRHAHRRLRDHHVAAQERSLGQIIGAALIGHPRGELRVNHRTMQAFVVVLEHQLPVGAHVVGDPVTHLEIREAESGKAADQRAVRLHERHRLARQIHEQKPFPLGNRGLMQRIVGLFEAGHLAHVGRADEPAIGGVGPGVVLALNRLGEVARLLGAEPGPAMPADVEEGAQRPTSVPKKDQALARDHPDEVVARRSEPVGAADADPVPGKKPLALFLENRSRVVILAGEGAGALFERAGRVYKRRHRCPPRLSRLLRSTWRAASQPGPPAIPLPG